MEKNRLPLQEFTAELQHNILPYWIEKMVDVEHGGFYGRRDGYDCLEKEADKGIILNTRILWTFSSAARIFKDHKCLQMASRAFTYLGDYFTDHEKGGVYWMVDYKGRLVDDKKQIYAQAFAIYAYAEYFLASGNKNSLEQAIALFHLIEEHSFDPNKDGYLEAFDREWNLLEDLRLSEKDANEKKTMNTHLHILEAYTVLYQAWPNPILKKQLLNLILIFTKRIINSRYQYDLFFNEHWELQSTITSFGHDIEGSWLLCEAAKAIGDAQLLKEVEALAIKTVNKTISDGLDEDGGLMNETTPDGITDTDKHWWPQAEALVGLVNAWEISRDDAYLVTANKVWSFIKSSVLDRVHGEWHWLIRKDGTVDYKEEKAGPWKCPYHNGRAIMEVFRRTHSFQGE